MVVGMDPYCTSRYRNYGCINTTACRR
uniref:Uncharacterized protein n=1 Tax=Rhizophora mucronata TaxID=61149 RepID=A0A2P2NQ60_RHIMU